MLARSRALGSAVETNARLQESARHAMAVIESDARMAGFWGLTNSAATITVNAALGFPPKCGGTAWLADTMMFVDGTNNSYLAVPDCGALSGGARTGTDVLIVRRASARRIAPQRPTVVVPDQDRVLVISNHASGQIFVPSDLGNAIPPGYATADVAGEPPLADTRALLVNAYYVSADSSVAKGFPALRRKTLTAGPGIGDEEIMPGVEDLQFQIGLDTTGDLSVDTYVNPGAMPGGALPLTLRIWLRLRAQDREPGYRDDQPMSYAGQIVAAPDDSFRRLLVTKTIHLRNARR